MKIFLTKEFIDKKHRIIFRFAGNEKVYFLTVGPHNWIYRIKF